MAKKIVTPVESTIAEATPVESTIAEATPVESTIAEATPVESVAVPTMKVGQRARQLIQEGVLDNKGILAILQKEYPQGKTSMACIAWYKSDLKKTKVDEDKPFKDWLKANDLRLRAEYEASLVTV